MAVNLIKAFRMLALVGGLTALTGPALAKIVVLDIDLPLDQVGDSGGHIKVGDHHHARIFFDDTKVNPKTHIVNVLHMQHFMGGNWIPARLDPIEMPMGDAWLDTGSKPFRYHYRSAIDGTTIVDFDDQTRRMTIRRQSDNVVLVSAPYQIGPPSSQNIDTADVFLRQPAYVINDVDITLDRVAENGTAKVGDHDKVHVVYDSESIDSKTHRVKLVNFQHFIHGAYTPAHPDTVKMPMNDAWLDVGSKPYRLHLTASVVHGVPIVIEVDENTRRLSILSSPDRKVLESGTYVIDPMPITGPEAVAAATVSPSPTVTAQAPADRPTSSALPSADQK